MMRYPFTGLKVHSLDGVKKSLFQIDCQGIFVQMASDAGPGERSKNRL